MGKYISVKEADNGLVLDISLDHIEVFEKTSSDSPILRYTHIEQMLTRLAEELIGHAHRSLYRDTDGTMKRTNVWVSISTLQPTDATIKLEMAD